ncbi:transcription termination factor Rho [bacterium]|nr:transcription termination factor Rho [bacterium]
MNDQPPQRAPLRGTTTQERDGDRVQGILFVVKDGYGFLRQQKNNYMSGAGDVYVPKNVIQRYRIRAGSEVDGALGRGRRGKKKRPLETVFTINGRPPEEHSRTKHYKDMTSIDPERRIRLEVRSGDVALRTVDLFAPIGFGQRALIVSPPKTGKTMLLQKIANALAENHPEARAIVLLVDERPEEVTDFRRTCKAAEVVASSLDQDPADHVAICEVVLERARRIVETGKDVVLFIDSLTRMARAFNTERGRSGRTLTGGLDSAAMQKPREIFGAARCAERGGSLTIVATCLVDTGSKMDQVIFEEFKGTGNMELILSLKLAERRVFPAIDMKASGTRKEEKLRDHEELRLVTLLRRGLIRYPPQKAMEALLEKLKTTQNNAEFLLQLPKVTL